MKRDFLLKLCRALSNANFSAPKRSRVVVFNAIGSDVFKKFVLHDIDHTMLYSDYEVFYIRPAIILRFIKNLIFVYLRDRKYRSLYLIYLLSCIEYIAPKIVLTFVDYNYLFHAISNIYTGADFYAIQNGIRNRYSLRDWLPKPPRLGSIYEMCNFVCFGQHDIELYRRFGHNAKRFHPVGSLVGSYFRSGVCTSFPAEEFDICLISQWRRSVMFGNECPELKKGLAVLTDFLSNFIKDRKVSFCIATCSREPEEREYFFKAFGSKARIIDFDWDNLSSYFAVARSNTTLTLSSTLAYEAFGWRKKILFCNFSGDSNYDFPREGPWSVNRQDYKEFEQKLEYLLGLSNDEYMRCAEFAARYVMNYNPSVPVHEYIRGIIKGCLNGDKRSS